MTRVRTMPLQINCDLGEGLDAIDAAVMPHIDLANIACGGHAGDKASMQRTVALAAAQGVGIGAHPSYPDRENFGRKRMNIAPEKLRDTLIAQVEKLITIAEQHRTRVGYIKPHGALYNNCTDPTVLAPVIEVARYFALPLMLMAGQPRISDACRSAKVALLREAFADRRYDERGLLVARNQSHALLNTRESLLQTRQLNSQGTITLSDGATMPLACDTLCVHSDTGDAVAMIKQLSRYLSDAH
ncbi:MAG TPA: 5-oxoprolinase subunit PxpA [Marinagarivorans sp.]